MTHYAPRLLRWLTLLTVICGQSLSALASAEPPNIVFILADDLSWSDLGCYGNSVHDTRNIDRLASEGLMFTQAYAPAPICSASRAATLTGKTPARLNFEFVTKNEPGRQLLNLPLQSPPFTMNLPLVEVTCGEALIQAGYTTGFFGKWHVNQHYEQYLGWSPTHSPLQQGFSEGSMDFGSHPYAYRSDRSLKDQTVDEGQYPVDTLTDEAIKYIRQHRSEPFFLYLSEYFVHDPIHSRCEWLVEKYGDRLPADVPKVRAAYAAMVESLDHQIDRVLNAIDEAGIAENTVVVLTSDNGGHPKYTTNAPLRGSKWNLYEGGIRVPMIVRWPGRILSDVDSHTVVHACDLLPTFCEIAQQPVPQTPLDGVSLLSMLTESDIEPERTQPLVWHFPYYHPEKRFHKTPKKIGVGDFVTSQTRPHSAIRDGDWKLVHFYEDNRIELYNLANDLAEQHNRADQRPELCTRLKTQLSDYLNEVHARLPKRVEQ